MTKEEADEKVRVAEQEVIRCAKSFGEKFETQSGVHAAVTKLLEAEAARAALDKPRLMTLEDARRVIYTQATSTSADGWTFHSNNGVQAILDAVRADILAQAEKLPRLHIDTRGQWTVTTQPVYDYPGKAYVVLPDAIFLSDLRNLINGAAA